MDGFVVRKRGKAAVLDVREGGCILLGKRRCEIPRDHHVDVIFLRFYARDPFEVYRLEVAVQKMRQQHPDCKTDRIGLAGGKPRFDLFEQLRQVLFEHFRRELVAGRPIVDERQKRFRRRHGLVIIADLLD